MSRGGERRERKSRETDEGNEGEERRGRELGNRGKIIEGRVSMSDKRAWRDREIGDRKRSKEAGERRGDG